MRAIRKINNNVVVCIDSTGEEILAMGKGIGFGAMPKELSLDEIERTFYDISKQDTELLKDLPVDTVEFAARMIDVAEHELPYSLSPNAALTLADHIAFAIERVKKNIRIKMPLAHDVRQMYPKEFQVAEYIIRRVKKEFFIALPENEASAITMNLLNSKMNDTQENIDTAAEDEEMLEEITEIIEDHFSRIIDRDTFNYSRYATHLQYLFQRIHQGSDLKTDNLKMYESLSDEYPEIASCVERIAVHIKEKWNFTVSDEEKMYLILHVNRVFARS